MKIQYSSNASSKEYLAKLDVYRARVQGIVDAANFTEPESSLATWQDDLMKTGVNNMVAKFGKISDLVLVGIGGSSLGTEAIHRALKTNTSPRLHVLDAVADHKIAAILLALKNVPKESLAICIVSKSGETAETLSNAAVILEQLGMLYGEIPYDRAICVGDKDNSLLVTAEKLGAYILPMHTEIGGRYSVFTAVGLLPLALLGYNIEEILDGLKVATHGTNEEIVAEGASTLYKQMISGVRVLNFFAFDTRLETLGYWYRQLAAESLGKEFNKNGNKVKIGFIPTISTPVELHSVGQLYFSGFEGVYTDFISLSDRSMEYFVSEDNQVSPSTSGKSLQEIAYAIEGGVVGAYEARSLPFRHTEIKRLKAHEIGLFMGSRMMEVMYLAELMNVNAFDQPNVELYKEKTREILNK